MEEQFASQMCPVPCGFVVDVDLIRSFIDLPKVMRVMANDSRLDIPWPTYERSRYIDELTPGSWHFVLSCMPLQEEIVFMKLNQQQLLTDERCRMRILLYHY